MWGNNNAIHADAAGAANPDPDRRLLAPAQAVRLGGPRPWLASKQGFASSQSEHGQWEVELHRHGHRHNGSSQLFIDTDPASQLTMAPSQFEHMDMAMAMSGVDVDSGDAVMQYDHRTQQSHTNISQQQQQHAQANTVNNLDHNNDSINILGGSQNSTAFLVVDRRRHPNNIDGNGNGFASASAVSSYQPQQQQQHGFGIDIHETNTGSTSGTVSVRGFPNPSETQTLQPHQLHSHSHSHSNSNHHHVRVRVPEQQQQHHTQQQASEMHLQQHEHQSQQHPHQHQHQYEHSTSTSTSSLVHAHAPSSSLSQPHSYSHPQHPSSQPTMVAAAVAAAASPSLVDDDDDASIYDSSINSADLVDETTKSWSFTTDARVISKRIEMVVEHIMRGLAFGDGDEVGGDDANDIDGDENASAADDSETNLHMQPPEIHFRAAATEEDADENSNHHHVSSLALAGVVSFHPRKKKSTSSQLVWRMSSISQSRNLTSMLLLLDLIYTQLLCVGGASGDEDYASDHTHNIKKHMTTRQVYYYYVTHFKHQQECTATIGNVCKLLHCPRMSLGIVASPKGKCVL
jgi:hypothetical protein